MARYKCVDIDRLYAKGELTLSAIYDGEEVDCDGIRMLRINADDREWHVYSTRRFVEVHIA